jgi:hypothetical protein
MPALLAAGSTEADPNPNFLHSKGIYNQTVDWLKPFSITPIRANCLHLDRTE